MAVYIHIYHRRLRNVTHDPSMYVISVERVLQASNHVFLPQIHIHMVTRLKKCAIYRKSVDYYDHEVCG